MSTNSSLTTAETARIIRRVLRDAFPAATQRDDRFFAVRSDSTYCKVRVHYTGGPTSSQVLDALAPWIGRGTEIATPDGPRLSGAWSLDVQREGVPGDRAIGRMVTARPFGTSSVRVLGRIVADSDAPEGAPLDGAPPGEWVFVENWTGTGTFVEPWSVEPADHAAIVEAGESAASLLGDQDVIVDMASEGIAWHGTVSGAASGSLILDDAIPVGMADVEVAGWVGLPWRHVRAIRVASRGDALAQGGALNQATVDVIAKARDARRLVADALDQGDLGFLTPTYVEIDARLLDGTRSQITVRFPDRVGGHDRWHGVQVRIDAGRRVDDAGRWNWEPARLSWSGDALASLGRGAVLARGVADAVEAGRRLEALARVAPDVLDGLVAAMALGDRVVGHAGALVDNGGADDDLADRVRDLANWHRIAALVALSQAIAIAPDVIADRGGDELAVDPMRLAFSDRVEA